MSRPTQTQLLAVLIAAPFLLLAGWKVWVPYSYWLDEIISVTFSTGSWVDLLDFVLNDVHPPLYQSLLKVWIAWLGPGEPQTRFLSLLFALGTVAVFILGVRGRPRSFVLPAALFLVSSGLYSFYAQETRPYALVLLAASAAAVMFANRAELPNAQKGRFLWYAVLLVLSLTHYFAWLLAVLLLLFDRFDYRNARQVSERLVLGVLMLAWPAMHIGLGSVSSLAGGNFWITSDGPLTTVGRAAAALLHPVANLLQGLVAAAGPNSATFIVVAGLLLMAAWGFLIATNPLRSSLARQSAILITFVALLVVIDLHTPMSTQRNYIVLIPVLALLVGGLFQTYWERYRRPAARTALALLLAGYGAIGAASSIERMQERWQPQQNWKELAAQVQEFNICEPHCWFADQETKWRTRFYPHYFHSAMGEYPERVVLTFAELHHTFGKRELPVVAAHVTPDELRNLLALLPGVNCWQPVQSWAQSVVLFAKDIDPRSTLRPCEVYDENP